MISERSFSLETPDGETLRGEVRTPRARETDTGILVLHGFKGFRRWGFFPTLCESLARAGHTVVSFDFSRNGVGPGGLDFDELEAFAQNTFSRELDEALQVGWAFREGDLGVPAPRRLGLLGHSRGGGIAVLAADRGPFDALVTWAAVATFDRWPDAVKEAWRRDGRIHIPNARTGQAMPLDRALLDDLETNRETLDIEAAAGRVDLPWLIVHGTDDTAVDPADSERLLEAQPRATSRMIEGAGHTFGATHPFEGVGPELESALEATIRHFERALGPGLAGPASFAQD